MDIEEGSGEILAHGPRHPTPMPCIGRVSGLWRYHWSNIFDVAQQLRPAAEALRRSTRRSHRSSPSRPDHGMLALFDKLN